MDKKSIIEIIMDVYKSLTPTKVSIFQKNEEVINIRVVSEIFSGMTFSSRFKFLNQILKDQQPDLFSKHIYVFEAFTSGKQNKSPFLITMRAKNLILKSIRNRLRGFKKCPYKNF